MFKARTLLFATLLTAGPVFGQGQDSETWERDLQVIATLIAGQYDNANQSYFDSRGGHDVRHRRLHIDVDPLDLKTPGTHFFTATSYWDNEQDAAHRAELWSLAGHAGSGSVRMRVWLLGTIDLDGDPIAFDTEPHCDVYWRRGAEQFEAESSGDCGGEFANSYALGERQLWVTYPGGAGDYRLHRARTFECYADIPGVGGGRDEPYERYEGFKTHDQGGQIWFTSKEGRRLGISLFLVDWPINNYTGIFTRDSFVIYVSEEIEGKRKEISYAFTVPEADRIGINLKWMLASCFMKSNKFETPSM